MNSTVQGWTVDTLAAHIERQLEDRRVMFQERYETQTKAVDNAFAAAQLAMQTALSNADRQVQTALTASEKAISQANAGTDKRFETISDKLAAMDERMQVALSALTSRLDLSTGRGIGFERGWAFLISLAGMATSATALYVALKR